MIHYIITPLVYAIVLSTRKNTHVERQGLYTYEFWPSKNWWFSTEFWGSVQTGSSSVRPGIDDLKAFPGPSARQLLRVPHPAGVRAILPRLRERAQKGRGIRTGGGNIMEVTWLVVGPPLWKIWKSIGMIRNPIYGKIKLMFQTTNQIMVNHGS